MEYFLPILFTIISVLLVIRPVTILCHELGHAIPAMLLTRKAVTIYLGSYGDADQCFKLTMGKFTFFVRYNPFKWRGGLCIPSASEIPRIQQIIYTLAGPLASFIIGGVAVYFTFDDNIEGFFKLFFILFMSSALLDAYVNLYPNPIPIRLANGHITFNDGYLLKMLISHNWVKISTGTKLYHKKRYAEAAILLEEGLSSSKSEYMYRLAISAYIQSQNYLKAKELSDEFVQKWQLKSADLSNMALAYSMLGFRDKAIELYDQSLELDPANKYSLNNKGLTLVALKRFEEGLVLFDKAIAVDSNFTYSFNYRGLTKIELGFNEEGLLDIKHALSLDPDNSDTFSALGVYYNKMGQYHDALKQFIKAKELNPGTQMIDELIKEAENQCGLK
ncbi:M50 family metallopeptidase [Chitinophaga sp. LS1]|uniref:M50 family metallopeptidase n=1 Tax=Chitinophaga sp. LS1 TaxID=3051176 RepID=UPI002AAADB92|nr:M50 family metallopeptidase [Chitinophaga sp. LS1]WPV65273.1 M50 family metallopeptidase [Chitinophaga sp. LS1]